MDSSSVLEARKQIIAIYGPRCAGWLTWEHRNALKQVGAFEVVITKGTPIPEWFFYATEFLKKRASWNVVIRTTKDDRRYQIHWLGHGTSKKDYVPSALGYPRNGHVRRTPD